MGWSRHVLGLVASGVLSMGAVTGTLTQVDSLEAAPPVGRYIVELDPLAVSPWLQRVGGELGEALRVQAVKSRVVGGDDDVLFDYGSLPYVALETDDPAALAAIDGVISVKPDVVVRRALEVSLGVINATNAQLETAISGTRADGAGQTVVIIDDGIDREHPFFRSDAGSSRVVTEACYNRTDCLAGATGQGAAAQYSGNWHGTHVAGIAAGSQVRVGTSTLRGVARNADIMAIKVFDANGSGSLVDVDRALTHVRNIVDTGLSTVSAVNMSLGTDVFASGTCDSFRSATATLIQQLRDRGVVTVIAAGNSGRRSEMSWPACISAALPVGASTTADAVASFSNVSSRLVTDGVMAPGASICSSVPTAVLSTGFGCAGGTSMASPHVAGALALLKQATTSATATALIAAARTTPTAIADTRTSATITSAVLKRLDVSSAIASTQQNTGTVTGVLRDATDAGSAVAMGATPMALALQSTSSPMTLTAEVTTAGDGRYSLTGVPVGTWNVTASVLGFPDTAVQSFTLVAGSAPTASVDVTVSVVTGSLQATVGAGPSLPAATVVSLNPRPGNPWQPINSSLSTDADGVLTLTGVRPGSWDLALTAGSWVSAAVTNIAVASNAVADAGLLTMSQQTGTLSATVRTDLGGQVLANTPVVVSATPVGAPVDRSAFETNLVTSSQGVATVPLMRVGGWQVTVSASDHDSVARSVTVPEGTVTDSWTLPVKRGALTGVLDVLEVVPSAGPGVLVPMAEIVQGTVTVVLTPTGTDAQLRSPVTSSHSVAATNNVFTVYGVLPGDWSVTATAAGFLQSGSPPAVTVQPGGSSADLVVAMNPVPFVATRSPASGPAAGGTTVTLTGLHLDRATSVTFGGVAGTSLSTGTGTTLSVVTPARGLGGLVSVLVTTPRGTASTTFTYDAPPVPTPTPSPTPPSSGGGGGGIIGGGGGGGSSSSDPPPATATVAAPGAPGGTVSVDVEVGDGVLGLQFSGVTGAGEVQVQQRSGTPESGTGGLRLVGRYVEITARNLAFQRAEVCVPYASGDPGELGVSDAQLRLMHFVGDLGRQDITSRVDTARRVVCGLTESFSPFAIGVPATERIAGVDRYSTAVELSKVFMPQGAAVVYLASGTGFADALAAGAAAASSSAPVLLTANRTLPSVVRAELQRLAPRQVVIVGGTGAVSSGVESAVRTVLPSASVVRVAGADRYATAVEVSKRAFPTGATTVYLATGRSFPDALAGAAAAGRDGAPVLLAPGTTLPISVMAELARLRPARVVLLGGATALSSSVASQVSAAVPTATISRLQGADRYATAASVANTFTAGVTVFVATGRNFPDALAGAAIAGGERGPVVVIPDGTLPASLRTAFTRLRPSRMVVLGGTGALSSASEVRVAAFLP